MVQIWHDLLFAHWPIEADVMRLLIPSSLELDLWKGHCWLAVVPFRMSGVRPRYLPAVPWLSNFPELNLRTYVRHGEKPGVYFFSLDAANPVAVAIARAWYHLPYFNARMHMVQEGDCYRYESQRTHAGIPPASFKGSYRPIGPVYFSTKGSLDAWLTERYSLYTHDPQGNLFIGEIHHAPWPLQPAEARFEVNQIAESFGFRLPDVPPLLHFSRRLDVLAWSLLRLPAAA
jgi:uncharacterized protein YqjF (DUF2071 family)